MIHRADSIRSYSHRAIDKFTSIEVQLYLLVFNAGLIGGIVIGKWV